MKPDALIDELDGSAAVAEFFGIEANTVGNWRKRGFPAWALPGLAQLCHRRGIDPGAALDPQPPRRIRAAEPGGADPTESSEAA
jgi:hypothetical protein